MSNGDDAYWVSVLRDFENGSDDWKPFVTPKQKISSDFFAISKAWDSPNLKKEFSPVFYGSKDQASLINALSLDCNPPTKRFQEALITRGNERR